MIYAVRLYTVDVSDAPIFMAAFRAGGLWVDIARLQPGHIHTDLLRNPGDPAKFMSIEFWTSVPAILAARRSAEVRRFIRWLSYQAIGCDDLGMFAFPPRQIAEGPSSGELSSAPELLVSEGESRQSRRSGAEVRP